MSVRSITWLSVIYILVLLGAIASFIFFTRSKNIELSTQTNQNISTQAILFTNTFFNMDTGLRYKSSQTLFAIAKTDKLLKKVTVFDLNKTMVLAWSDNSLSKNYIINSNFKDFDTKVYTIKLSNNYSLISEYQILNFTDISLAFIILVSGMVVFIIILIFQFSKSQTESIIESERIEESPIDIIDADNNHEVKFEPIKPNEPSENTREASEIQTSELPPPESKFLIIDQKTGVTQDKFLDFRLNKELERSAENAIDISIIIFKFLNLKEANSAEAAKLLLLEFSHEDLIFKSNANTFTVLLPQHDLDQGIARADLLIRKAESHFPRTIDSVTTIAGLSSRNGRLLDAKRFINEAQVALSKANIREGRIVGFRPDPVRYRNFLRHHLV